jgi:hypothetical protein
MLAGGPTLDLRGLDESGSGGDVDRWLGSSTGAVRVCTWVTRTA